MQLLVHPQLINTFMDLVARGRAVQNGTQPVSDLTQPQRPWLGNTCLAMMDWPHTYPAWFVVLLTCSTCLPREQAGVRSKYSTTYHIHAIDKLKEKCREYNIPLCCFRGLREGIRLSTNPSNTDIMARTRNRIYVNRNPERYIYIRTAQ